MVQGRGSLRICNPAPGPSPFQVPGTQAIFAPMTQVYFLDFIKPDSIGLFPGSIVRGVNRSLRILNEKLVFHINLSRWGDDIYHKFIKMCELDLHIFNRHPVCGPPFTPPSQALQSLQWACPELPSPGLHWHSSYHTEVNSYTSISLGGLLKEKTSHPNIPGQCPECGRY